MTTSNPTDIEIRDKVRERYAAAATAVAESTGSGCCGAQAAIAGCGPDIASTDKNGNEVFGAPLRERGRERARRGGRGLARLRQPDRGRRAARGRDGARPRLGGGIDVLLSARRVGPTGKAYGLDMTDEMLELARANAAEAGVDERRVPEGRHRGHPAARRVASTWSSPTA